ncbi:MAG: PHP domain-containing protein [Chloroflexi bacterium]|nr:PHP domain-containing protein [Chloroflexota bacterium]
MPTLIDLHSHSKVLSTDSNMDPDDLVARAKAAGLDGICITEHGNKRFPLAAVLTERHGILVIGAFEASTELGDILCFGLEGYPRMISRAVELRAYVQESDAVMVAAHPFRYDLSPKPWLKRASELTVEQGAGRKILSLVDAMETVNGWAVQADVDFCLAVSAHLGLPGTGGSDAHDLDDVGICYTEFDDLVRSEAELLAALRSGRYRAVDRRIPEKKSPVHLTAPMA